MSCAIVSMTTKTSRLHSGEQGGFALLLVIGVLVLLSLAAALLAASSDAEIRMARNRADLAQAQSLADAGVTLSLAWLMDADDKTRWHADGSAHVLNYGGGTITVSVQDEGGKVNINAAPLDLIDGLLNELGVDTDERNTLVAAIDARRQAFTPQTVFHGIAAFNAPFAAVSELRLLPSVTRRTYDLMRPFVTVYSYSAAINPLTAPREVLLGVPGISPQEVEFFLPARNEASNGQPGAELPKLSGVDRYVYIGAVSTVTITAKAVAASGAGSSSNQPYQILEWGQDLDDRSGQD